MSTSDLNTVNVEELTASMQQLVAKLRSKGTIFDATATTLATSIEKLAGTAAMPATCISKCAGTATNAIVGGIFAAKANFATDAPVSTPAITT